MHMSAACSSLTAWSGVVSILTDRLVEKMSLNNVLARAEQVFFTYCCRSVSSEDAEAYLLK